MKKLIVFAAIAAMVIPFVSCNNKIDYGDGPQAKIEKAKNADDAKKITVQSGNDAYDQGYQQIEFTDGGRYIITRSSQKTKADDDTEILTGTYTVQNNVYVLAGFGSIEFGSNGSFTIKLEGGVTVTGTGQEEPKLPDNDFSRDIAHTWKIDGVDLSVVADGKNVGVIKPNGGCNLEVIGQELLDQAKNLGVNVSVDLSKLKGYNVVSLSFTSSNTFIVDFSGAAVVPVNDPAHRVIGDRDHRIARISCIEDRLRFRLRCRGSAFVMVGRRIGNAFVHIPSGVKVSVQIDAPGIGFPACPVRIAA